MQRRGQPPWLLQLLGLCACAWVATGDPAAAPWGPWRPLSPAPVWGPRLGAAGFTVPATGALVVAGGRTSVGCVNDVWRSYDGGQQWEEGTAAAAWAPREGAVGLVDPASGVLLLAGGALGDGTPTNDVHRSADGGRTWTVRTSAAAWAPRFAHVGVALTAPATLLIMGGAVGAGVMVNDVWQSTDGGTTWTEVFSALRWAPRSFHVGFAVQTPRTVIIGGGTDHRGTLADVWASADGGRTWTTQTALGLGGHRMAAAAVTLPDATLVVFGGQTPAVNLSREAWGSTDRGHSWTRLATHACLARLMSVAFVAPTGHRTLFVAGGADDTGVPLADAWLGGLPSPPVVVASAASRLPHPNWPLALAVTATVAVTVVARAWTP